jgi:hypothetical protein
VIDQGSKTLFVNAFTHEDGAYYHRLHALDITTGAERPYSPVTVAVAVSGPGAGSTNGVIQFEAKQHLQRPALTLADGVLYVSYCGHGDTDPYHGWLIGYSAANLKLLQNFVFNSTPNSTTDDFGPNAGEGGIWMAGCGPSVDASGNLYFATGNGSFDGITEYGGAFLKLSSRGGLAVADYFAPYNQQYLSDNNLDLGSGGLMLLPDQVGPYRHLLVGGSKAGIAYVLNRDRFTTDNNHYNSTGNTDLIAQELTLSSGVLCTPAYYEGTIYFGPVMAVLTAFRPSEGDQPTAVGSRVLGYPGATPSVSANKDHDGIVWAIHRGSPAVLVAWDASDITRELYDSTLAADRDQLGPGVKFAVPTIANGKVYVGGKSVLSVFGLLPETPANSNSTAGNFNGLFLEDEAVQFGVSGPFALTVTKRGGYSGKLEVGSKRYSFTGKLDSTGSGTKNVPRRGAAALTLAFQIDPDDNTRISGTVSDGDWTAGLIADRSVFNARTNPAPFAGRHTAIFPGSPNTGAPTPYGSGFATIKVNASGSVVCSASLADGTKFSQSARLSHAGDWPFYASLYRGRGQVIGWLNFTASAEPELSGQTSWIKGPGAGGGNYIRGFEVLVSVTGSPYQPPSRGMPILGFSQGYASFTGGNPNQNFVNAVAFAANNKITNLSSNKLTLTLTPTSGLFRGTVKPAGGRTFPFNGVVLQSEDTGSGYYLLGSQSGRVDLNAQ